MLTRSLLIVAIFSTAALAALAQSTPVPPPRSLSVTGTAERQVAPNVGYVTVAVETRAETVAQAVRLNNQAANRVIDAIRRLNMAGLTLRTLGFDVSPVYEQVPPSRPSPQPLRIVAYVVVNRVQARIAQQNPDALSEAVGDVLDTALKAGANRVDNVRFELDDSTSIMNELLAQATKNARETAGQIAAAAGVTLLQPLSISTSPYFQPPMPLYARSADASAEGVPIQAGMMTVRATVSISYEIR